jgi:hypothetical protein
MTERRTFVGQMGKGLQRAHYPKLPDRHRPGAPVR